jgi:hypothetical protein
LGVLPTLRDLPGIVARLHALAVHALPVYARGTVLALGHAQRGGVLALIWLVTATLLVLAGIWIARRSPQPMSWKGAS